MNFLFFNLSVAVNALLPLPTRVFASPKWKVDCVDSLFLPLDDYRLYEAVKENVKIVQNWNTKTFKYKLNLEYPMVKVELFVFELELIAFLLAPC